MATQALGAGFEGFTSRSPRIPSNRAGLPIGGDSSSFVTWIGPGDRSVGVGAGQLAPRGPIGSGFRNTKSFYKSRQNRTSSRALITAGTGSLR